jgi:hypothetical protein
MAEPKKKITADVLFLPKAHVESLQEKAGRAPAEER